MNESISRVSSNNQTQKGRIGEELAAVFLSAKGYQIFFRNFRCRYGELDIVARKGRELAFVEVKTRTTTEYGLPAEAVTSGKRRHMVQAGAFFLQRFGLQHLDVRFDVIEVQLTHIENI